MKKWLWLALLLIGAALVVKLAANKPKPLTEPKHPYAIESLKSHVNKMTAIVVENKVGRQNGFESDIISFISDGAKEYGLMNIPTGKAPEGGWPVVILSHGHVTPSQYSTVSSYKNTAAYLAQHGFLVLKPDFRGHDKSGGSIDQLVSRNQYAVDVLNLMEGVKTIKQANPKKIFLYGHSMGGEVSLEVAEVSDKIKAVVLWAPAVNEYPLDMTYFLKQHGLSWGQMESMATGYNQLVAKYGSDQFSSLSHVGDIKVPILIQQSVTDESVPFAWGEGLNQKLMTAGKQVSFVSYPGDDHNISHHFTQALDTDIKFFNSIK